MNQYKKSPADWQGHMLHSSSAGGDKVGHGMGLRGPAGPGGRLIVSHVPWSEEGNGCCLNENLAEMFVCKWLPTFSSL